MQLYARRFLARRLGRNVHTLSIWQQQGWIPQPIFDISEKSTWLTFDELLIYERAHAAHRMKRGLRIEGSRFSNIVLAEVAALRKGVERSGPQILKPGLDMQEVLAELNEIKKMSMWRRTA